ncbi:DNA-directed RNA polymerase subunit beta' [Candidatus Vidania fulgoroideorum]
MKKINFLEIYILTNKEIILNSSGEVKNSETINYRTLKPEVGGLFCQKIFGPIKKNFCNCNKFKISNVLKNKCKICNVKINSNISRRINFGHISLRSPVVHIWFFKSIPSKISLILNIKLSILEKIIYYEKYIIIESKIKKFKKGLIINEKKYYNLKLEYKDKLIIKTGAEAIEILLKNINIYKEFYKTKNILKKINKKNNKEKKYYYKNLDRLKIFRSFIINKTKLNIFVFKNIPVLPPDLRPIIKIKKDKFASSDLNELYKRIIDRNNRLKRLFNIGAPEFVIKEEKKLLQESVDCLFDNGRRSKFFKSNKKLFKSLSENIKGKKGRFRQNLLGKRVDYSARSVIVVEPNMKLTQCGIPKKIAFELFRPFIYNFLIKNGISITYNVAKEEVDMKTNVALEALKKIIKKRPILINRAPTLHKLSIQGFYPFLVNDNAIHIHPLICTSFNADFDGDQMAVHIPLSYKSVLETKKLLLSSKNILNSSNGNISILPTQDIILGLNFLSEKVINLKNNFSFFDNFREVINYYYLNGEKNEKIIFKINKSNFIKTTVRRIFLYSLIPIKKIFFNYNKILVKKDVYNMINDIYNFLNKKKFIKFLCKLTSLGFHFATLSGISLSISDICLKVKKKKIINCCIKTYYYYYMNYKKKNISLKEKIKKSNKIWKYFINYLNFLFFNSISKKKKNIFNKKKYIIKNNSLYKIFCSGAKGTDSNLYQIISTRGFIIRTDGTLFNIPIISNFKDGLNSIQYFISSYGARKGLSDTSLKTANSGYLTRRLIDVSQDLVINKKNCYTKKFSRVIIKKNINRYFGYCLYNNVYLKNKKIINKNTLIDEKIIKKIIKSKINYLTIRSPIFCNLNKGICSYCYGMDFSNKKIVDAGKAVGVIAAQSIGEPGTQLTMRTFHTGGVFLLKNKFIKSSFDKFCFVQFYHDFNFSYKNFYFNKFKINLININGKLLKKKKINAGYNFNIFNNYNLLKLKLKKNNNNIYCIFGYVKFLNFNKNIYIKKKKYYLLKNKIFSNTFIKLVSFNKIFFIPIINKYLVEIKKKKLFNIIYIKYFHKKKIKGDITNSLELISNIFENRNKKSNYSYITGKYKIQNNILKIKNNEKKLFFKLSKNYINFFDNIIIRGYSISKNFNLPDYLNIVGIEKFNNYFKNKIYNIYKNHGIFINRKHIEIILKQMISSAILIKRSKINFFNFQILNRNKLINFNKKKRDLNIFKTNLIGITKSSLSFHSFISSASFQNTVNILVNSSLLRKKDFLLGIKENVILGRLIPSGTGFFNSLSYKYFF